MGVAMTIEDVDVELNMYGRRPYAVVSLCPTLSNTVASDCTVFDYMHRLFF